MGLWDVDPTFEEPGTGRLRRLREARDAQRWREVVVLGGRVLTDPRLSPVEIACTHLDVGTARFMLGEFSEALSELRTGLELVPEGIVDRRPYRYWAGMAAQNLGDLAEARRNYESVVGPRSDDGFPVGSARRALAQLALESGDAEEAVALLAPADGGAFHPMGRALHTVALQRTGDELGAHAGVQQVLQWCRRAPDGLPQPEHATIATMLCLVAEVAVELGADDLAEVAVLEAERRCARAGEIRSEVIRRLGVLRGEVARLRGDVDRAGRELAEVLPRPDEPELTGAHHRATARLARARGDRDIARAYYERAVEAFAAGGFAYLAEATQSESGADPVA